jgi:hypothetical protein
MLKYVRVAVWALGLSAPIVSFAKAGWTLTEEKGQWMPTVTASYHDKSGKQLAFVKCENGHLDVHLTSISAVGVVKTQHWIDGRPQEPLGWLVTPGGALASHDTDVARAFLNGKEFEFKVTVEQGYGRSLEVKIPLDGAREPVAAALKTCGYELEGMETRIAGLRPEIARDLEHWGPKYTIAAKRVLQAAGAYDGAIDETIDAKFALAAQAYHDKYVDDCKAGRVDGDTFCHDIRKSVEKGHKPWNHGLGTMIYDSATGKLKKEMGGLRPRS